MKNLFIGILILFCIAFSSCTQLKILNATNQKIFGGRGGVIMTYKIEFSVKSSSDKNKTSIQTEIDSLKSVADLSTLDFNLNKKENGSSEITFLVSLAKPEKCKTCRDVSANTPDLTKGVIVYYKRGEKISSFKTKKFKQLPDVNMP